MLSTNVPNWKKIGRHVGRNVGKKLKDVLNPPDAGPSKEERRAQRLKDVFKGFLYFEDFDDVIAWRADRVDPILCANTGLLRRPASGVDQQDAPKANVLLCHDYNGQLYSSIIMCSLADTASRRLSRLRKRPPSPVEREDLLLQSSPICY